MIFRQPESCTVSVDSAGEKGPCHVLQPGALSERRARPRRQPLLPQKLRNGATVLPPRDSMTSPGLLPCHPASPALDSLPVTPLPPPQAPLLPPTPSSPLLPLPQAPPPSPHFPCPGLLPSPYFPCPGLLAPPLPKHEGIQHRLIAPCLLGSETYILSFHGWPSCTLTYRWCPLRSSHSRQVFQSPRKIDHSLSCFPPGNPRRGASLGV